MNFSTLTEMWCIISLFSVRNRSGPADALPIRLSCQIHLVLPAQISCAGQAPKLRDTGLPSLRSGRETGGGGLCHRVPRRNLHSLLCGHWGPGSSNRYGLQTLFFTLLKVKGENDLLGRMPNQFLSFFDMKNQSFCLNLSDCQIMRLWLLFHYQSVRTATSKKIRYSSSASSRLKPLFGKISQEKKNSSLR